MMNYTRKFPIKVGHNITTKPQLYPHKCKTINYGAKSKYSDEPDTRSPIDKLGIHRVQHIICTILYYA